MKLNNRIVSMASAVAVACAVILTSGASGQCEPAWIPTFVDPGVNSTVLALTVFDDGSGAGSALYAGGIFTWAGGVTVNRIAKWDGTAWSALGSGMNGWVYALTVFDDGSGAGPVLYAGGSFTTAGGVTVNRIAKWDGAAWSALGSGMSGWVYALTDFDDGSGGGPALYAGGDFTTAGGVTVNRIAKWDGAAWSALGSGMNSLVSALSVFDDGSGGGPALYAGGFFTTAGGVTVNGIAKWDGAAWSALGSGMMSSGSPSVNALTVFDDGSGPALYAGGGFTTAGGVSASRIAKWDGGAWSALGSGMSSDVHALTVFDGSGPALYAGGAFITAGGVTVNRIAKWDGTAWSALGSGMSGGSTPYVYALTVFDDGSGAGPALYAGGDFTTAGGVSASRIAKWDGAAWSALGGGMNNRVFALTVFDNGSGGGPALYAGGDFTTAGGATVNRIAKWDGTAWSALGSGMNSSIFALTVFDDGSGPALYAGGVFTIAGGVMVNRIAKWDGAAWSPLGSGMNVNNWVNALTVFDDGSGPALYAGGGFTGAGGVTVNGIARWDGAAWSALGSGMNFGVSALTVFDDGSGGGPALYAGGDFTTAGGLTVNRIAKWDGAAWSALGSGMDSIVRALTVFDDGSGGGPALHAGGDFTTAGGATVSRIARWDGAAWSALGTGMGGGSARALTVFDDGSGGGPALYAGGNFGTAGGVTVNRIARWDGAAWSALGSGMNNSVRALTVFDDGSGAGPALYAGGYFFIAGGLLTKFLAKWQGCPPAPPCYADCDGSGTLNIDDFLCFQLHFALADPYADCDGNSVFNIDDFLCFQLAFALGC